MYEKVLMGSIKDGVYKIRNHRISKIYVPPLMKPPLPRNVYEDATPKLLNALSSNLDVFLWFFLNIVFW